MINWKTNHITKDKFVRIVKDNWIINNQIKVGDVRRSHKIYGPLLPEIKGKTRYKESPRIQETEIVQIPEFLYRYLKNIVLCVDFHYLNGVAVLHSISRKVDYRTVSFPLSWSKNSIVSEPKEIYKIYNARSFKIVKVHAYKELDKTETDIFLIRLRICGVDEHVPKI